MKACKCEAFDLLVVHAQKLDLTEVTLIVTGGIAHGADNCMPIQKGPPPIQHELPVVAMLPPAVVKLQTHMVELLEKSNAMTEQASRQMDEDREQEAERQRRAEEQQAKLEAERAAYAERQLRAVSAEEETAKALTRIADTLHDWDINGMPTRRIG